VTEPDVWQWDTRKTRITGGLSRAPYAGNPRALTSPRKKLNLGLVEMQFPAVLRGLHTLLLVNLLLRSQFLHPLPLTLTISMQIGINYKTHIFQKWGGMFPRSPVAPPVHTKYINWQTQKRVNWQHTYRAWSDIITLTFTMQCISIEKYPSHWHAMFVDCPGTRHCCVDWFLDLWQPILLNGLHIASTPRKTETKNQQRKRLTSIYNDNTGQRSRRHNNLTAAEAKHYLHCIIHQCRDAKMTCSIFFVNSACGQTRAVVRTMDSQSPIIHFRQLTPMISNWLAGSSEWVSEWAVFYVPTNTV